MIKLNVNFPKDNKFSGYSDLIYDEILKNPDDLLKGSKVLSQYTDGMKGLFFTILYKSIVDGDGHYGYLEGYGNTWPYVLSGFELLLSFTKHNSPTDDVFQITNYVTIFRNVLTLFPGGRPPLNLSQIKKELEKVIPKDANFHSEINKKLGGLDNQFYLLDKKYPLREFWDSFIKNYPDQFFK